MPFIKTDHFPFIPSAQLSEWVNCYVDFPYASSCLIFGNLEKFTFPTCLLDLFHVLFLGLFGLEGYASPEFI